MQDDQCGFKKYEVQSIPMELSYKNFDNQQILNWFTKVEQSDA